jgi:V8-like Glu-specific endopeptidase
LFKLLLGTGLSLLSLCTQLISPAAAVVFDRQGQSLSEVNLDYSQINWQLLKSENSRTYNGIGLIKIRDFSSCTGFFIQPKPSQSAPAYVLTNGHCIDLLESLLSPSEIVVDRNLRSFGRSPAILSFTPGYFANSRGRRTYPVKRVLYATMKNNDVALLELSISQKDLIAAGVNPLQLANKPAAVGTKVDIVGVPAEKIAFEYQYLHRVSCSMGATVRVREGGYDWKQSLRHRCSLLGGMSGSPMIAATGNKVVGIVNTGGGSSDRRSLLCTLDNPCEVTSDFKPKPTASFNYGQLLDRLPGCFDQGVFNLNLSSCRLEKP